MDVQLPDGTLIKDVPDGMSKADLTAKLKGNGYDAWARGVAEIAKRPNVIGKLSGIVAYTDTATWKLDDIRPYAEHTISSFGFDRMVWGSDWPVCTLGGSLSTWVGATHALLHLVNGVFVGPPVKQAVVTE